LIAADLTGARLGGPDYQNLHRNKRMVSLDLKSEDGHAAFVRLVERAALIVENMRVQVKHRLKIAWEDVHPINPRLVYGSISGFGQSGPYSDRGGVDQIAQGMGGLMSITGLPGQGPVRVGIAISDLTAGNLLAFGVMVALVERVRTVEKVNFGSRPRFSERGLSDRKRCLRKYGGRSVSDKTVRPPACAIAVGDF
jgi:crotonobetainyl-CoA:carnitine CoA-transferase CaiB-like acyl-CoA transferase